MADEMAGNRNKRERTGSLLALVSFTGTLLLTSWMILTDRASSSPIRWTIALLLPFIVATYGVKKKSLDIAGGALAFLVGFVHVAASNSFCAIMIAFFITGSRLSKWKRKVKESFEPREDSGPTRDWKQVFCNGVVSSLASVLYLHANGMGESQLIISKQLHWPTMYSLAVLGSISCCCGDTWASEIGSAVGHTPRLITNLRLVPRGTNGGVSFVGIFASALGGLFVGVVYCVMQLLLLSNEGSTYLWIVILSTLAGLFGSLVDSLLGATFQYSGYNTKTGKITHSPGQSDVKHISGLNVLSNNDVNLLSSLITAFITPIVFLVMLNFF